MLGSAAQAGLTLSLKFDDGTLVKDISTAAAGTTYTVDVWATLTGANADTADEGLNGLYFGILTKQLLPSVAGEITAGVRADGLTASGGSAGAFQDVGGVTGLPAKDGFKDWGGNTNTATPGWARVYAGSGTYVAGSEMKIASATFTLGGVSGSLPIDLTDGFELAPYLPGLNPASTRGTWKEDGSVLKTGANGTLAVGSSVKFQVKGTVVNFPDIDANTNLVDLGTVLRGVDLPTGSVVLSNVGSAPGDYTATADPFAKVVSGGAGSIAAGGTADLVLSLQSGGGKPGGLRTGKVTVDVPATDPDGDFEITVQAVVGIAAIGQEVKAQIQAGGPYKGIGLSVAPGQGALGTDADLLGGTSDGGPVSFKFLKVSDNTSSLPAKVGLISDILDLSTDDDGTIEPFVLAMTYQESLMAGLGEAEAARSGFIYLGWDNNGKWTNAVNGNFGGSANFDGVGPVPQFGGDVSAMLGHWGVDINSNTVWAVLNHNSKFAVLPEPATFGLLGLGAMGLLARRRRA